MHNLTSHILVALACFAVAFLFTHRAQIKSAAAAFANGDLIHGLPAGLKAELESLTGRASSIVSGVVGLEERAKAAEATLAELAGKVEAALATIADMEARLKTAFATVMGHVTTTGKDLTAVESAVKAGISALEARVKSAEDSLGVVKVMISRLDSRLVSLEPQLAVSIPKK